MITLTPRIHNALELAARLHREQVRRDNLRTPYITHLMCVMLILSEETDDEVEKIVLERLNNENPLVKRFIKTHTHATF